MQIADYLALIKPLSIHARFSIGLRMFERYIRVRGLEDASLWTYLSQMWEFPLLNTSEQRLAWEKDRCELADYGLGDELPEELEEELYSLAINEDFFELWVTHVTELAWTNLLKQPQDDESLHLLAKICQLAAKAEIGAPALEAYQTKPHQYISNHGWGASPTEDELNQWQSIPCSIQLEPSEAPELELDYTEAIACFE